MATELYNERVRELFGMARGPAGGARQSRLLERTATGVETLEADASVFQLESLELQVEQLKLLKKVERGIRDLKKSMDAAGGGGGGALDMLGDALDLLDGRRSRRGGGARGGRGPNRPAASAPRDTPAPRRSQPRDAETGRYIRETTPRRNSAGVTHPRAAQQAATRATADAETRVAQIYRSASQSVGRAVQRVTAVPSSVMSAGRSVVANINASVSGYAMRAATAATDAMRSGASAVANAARGGLAGGGVVAGAGRAVANTARSGVNLVGKVAAPVTAALAVNDYRAGATNRDLIGNNPSVGTRNIAGLATAADGALNWGLGNPLDAITRSMNGRGFAENVVTGYGVYESWAGRQADSIKAGWANLLEGARAGGGSDPGSPDAVKAQLSKTAQGRAVLSMFGLGAPSVDLTPLPATKGGRVAKPTPPAPHVEFPADRWATDTIGLLGPRREQLNDRADTLDWFKQRTAQRVISTPGNGDTQYRIAGDAPQLTTSALQTTITTLKTATVKIQQSLSAQTDAVVGATAALEQTVTMQGDTFTKLNNAITKGGLGFGGSTGPIGVVGGGGAPTTTASGGPAIGYGGGNGLSAADQITGNVDPRAPGAAQHNARAASNRARQRLTGAPVYTGDTAPVTTRAFSGDSDAKVQPGTYGAFTGTADTDYKPITARAAAQSGGPTGSLSAKYEGEVGTVGGDGGRAYGRYQFDYKAGGLQRFFADNPTIASQFNGLQPGTPAFNERWKKMAADDPKGFGDAQDRSARNLWYNPAAEHARGAGFRTDNRGVQEALFSGSIQHGEFNRLLDETAATPGFKDMDAAGQIKAFYAARRKFDRVQRLDPQRRAGVLSRYDREEPDALALAAENAGATGPTTTNARLMNNGFMSGDGTMVPFKPSTLGTGPQGDALARTGQRRGAANLFSGRGSQLAQTFNPREDLTAVQTPSGQSWNVHRDAAYAFQGFLTELEASGYPLYSSGGYNDRNKRGGSSKSEHAFGTAVDVNSRENPMGPNLVTDLPPNVSDMAARWGLSWGGDWKGTKDAMHFEWRGISEEDLLDARNNPTGVNAVKVQKILAQAAERGGTGGRGGGLASILGKGGGIVRKNLLENGQRVKDDILDPAAATRASRARTTELDKQLDVERAKLDTIERADRSAAIADTVDGRGGRVTPQSNFDARWDTGAASQTSNAALSSAMGRIKPPAPVEAPAAPTTPTADTGRGGRVTATTPVAAPTLKPPAVPTQQTSMNEVPDIGELKMLMANSNMMA